MSTRLPRPATPRAKVYWLPTVRALKVATLQEMARQVREYRSHERLRTRVRQIMADAGVESGDYDGEIRAIWDFVCKNVRYQRDPIGAEHITGPLAIDEQIDEGYAAEDCESIVTYAATLFAANGTWSEFEIYGFDPGEPTKFTHVALAIRPNGTAGASGRWVIFDTVGACHRQGFGLGDTVWRPGLPIERWSLEGKQVPTKVHALNPIRGAAAPKGRTTMEDIFDLGFGDVDPAAVASSIINALGAGVASGANIYGAVTGKTNTGAGQLSPAQLAELQRQQAAGLPWWKDPRYSWVLYAGAALLAAKALRVI